MTRKPISLKPGLSPWQEIAAQKRQQRDSAIPKAYRLPDSILAVAAEPNTDVRSIAYTCGILTPFQLAITDHADPSVILAQIAKGDLTARVVTEAFCARAAVAHQLTNCLSEILFESALKRADELDAFYASHGRVIGPLHGLPISLKDQFDISGVDSSIGFVSLVDKPASEDSVIVSLLAAQGAVFHCKTNVPQYLMSSETNNNVFGRTVNPLNVSLTCGGSSGGEGALLAMHGSVLGLGTDYGGSIRVPAAFCGLYGLRPTMRRVPYSGVTNVMQGAEGIESVIGPMGRSIEALDLFMEAVADGKPWLLDPKVVERPWTVTSLNGPLTIAIVSSNGVVRPTPPISRAIAQARSSLLAAGHTVIDWEGPDFAMAGSLFGRFSCADGGADLWSYLDPSGEPLLPETFDMVSKSAQTVSELYKVFQDRDMYRLAFQRSLLALGHVDLIVCPTNPLPATPHRGTCFAPEEITYTGVWSILDLPVLNVPVTRVEITDKPLRPLPTEYWSDCDQTVTESYSPSNHLNAPVGLQLVSPRRFAEDELVAMAMSVVPVIAPSQDQNLSRGVIVTESVSCHTH